MTDHEPQGAELPPPTREEAIKAMARAILKARFYDCAPEAYESLEDFYAGLDAQHQYESLDEARDAYDALLAMGAIREGK
jgi:hypothetical protein